MDLRFRVGDRVVYRGMEAEIYLLLPFAADMDYLLRFADGSFQCVPALVLSCLEVAV